jgi:hypothetical protein
MDYLQERDVEMPISINEDDKQWVRRAIARAGGSTANPTPWPQWVEYVRLWSVPTIAVALLIFTLNEWSKYIEFRTHTNDALQTIQDALHVLQLSRAADTPTSPSSQAEAKAVIAQAKKNPSRPLPIPIIEHAGTKFVDASPNDPGAWNVALDFAAYRSVLNTPEVPGYHWAQLGQPLRPPPTANDTTAFVTQETVPCTNGAMQARATDVPGMYLFNTGPAGGHGPCAAFLRFVGGEVTLDGSYYVNTIFENMKIIYHGGPIRLENVTFVNCTFDLSQPNPEAMRLASAVLASNRVTL